MILYFKFIINGRFGSLITVSQTGTTHFAKQRPGQTDIRYKIVCKTTERSDNAALGRECPVADLEASQLDGKSVLYERNKPDIA